MTPAGQRPAGLRIAYALLPITPALWSLNYPIARWAPGAIAPHALALGHWTVAALVLAAFCGPELFAKRAHIRHEWKQFVVLGARGIWVCAAFVHTRRAPTCAIRVRTDSRSERPM